MKELIQGHRFSAGDIVRLTGCIRILYRRSEQVGLNDIRDIAEIACCLSISENPAPLAPEQARNPAGNHGGVGAGGSLTPPEDLSVAQAHRLEAVAHLQRLSVGLVTELWRGVQRLRTTGTFFQQWIVRK